MIPPIFKTFPVNEISPVIAYYFSIGWLLCMNNLKYIASDIKDDVMAIPALGPSFLQAPI